MQQVQHAGCRGVQAGAAAAGEAERSSPSAACLLAASAAHPHCRRNSAAPVPHSTARRCMLSRWSTLSATAHRRSPLLVVAAAALLRRRMHSASSTPAAAALSTAASHATHANSRASHSAAGHKRRLSPASATREFAECAKRLHTDATAASASATATSAAAASNAAASTSAGPSPSSTSLADQFPNVTLPPPRFDMSKAPIHQVEPTADSARMPAPLLLAFH